MEKETIITLEDNSEYGLLDETTVDGRKFFFAVRVNPDGSPTTEYEIFEEEKEGEDTYMSILDEGDFKQAILVDFTNNYMHMVGEMMDKQEEGTI